MVNCTQSGVVTIATFQPQYVLYRAQVLNTGLNTPNYYFIIIIIMAKQEQSKGGKARW